jgi:hypothetical protein
MHELPPWSWDELLSELPTSMDELWTSSLQLSWKLADMHKAH